MHSQLKADPFDGAPDRDSERAVLRAALDFHPTVCESFFAENVVLVEGDSEAAILRFADQVLACLGREDVNVNSTTVVSCGGKWMILPIARLMKAFGIPCKAIHDLDRKGLTEAELAERPAVHPYKVNARILDVLGEGNVLLVDDTLEDILFPDAGERSGKDKPYRAWKQVGEFLVQGAITGMNRLVGLYRFAFDID